MSTRRVLATPAHGGPREMKALMYLSFQACGCWLRKYKVYMLPMLWAMSTTGPPAFSAISSIICCSARKYSLFSSDRGEKERQKRWGNKVPYWPCCEIPCITIIGLECFQDITYLTKSSNRSGPVEKYGLMGKIPHNSPGYLPPFILTSLPRISLSK